MKPVTSTDIWFCCDYLVFTAGLKSCQIWLALSCKLLTKRNKGPCLLFSFQAAPQTPNRLLGTQGQTIKCLCTLWTFFLGTPLALQIKRGAGSPVIPFPPTLGRISKHLAATFLLPQMSAYHMEILMSGAPFPPQRGMFRTWTLQFIREKSIN